MVVVGRGVGAVVGRAGGWVAVVVLVVVMGG
jgi:hypothetical protein